MILTLVLSEFIRYGFFSGVSFHSVNFLFFGDPSGFFSLRILPLDNLIEVGTITLLGSFLIELYSDIILLRKASRFSNILLFLSYGNLLIGLSLPAVIPFLVCKYAPYFLPL